MSLSAEQLSDIRGDLADTTTPYAFSDAELSRLHDRAGGNYNQTIALAIRQLLMSAAKFYNYTAGFTKEERADIFDHLKDMLVMYQSNSALMVGIAEVPPVHRSKPESG